MPSRRVASVRLPCAWSSACVRKRRSRRSTACGSGWPYQSSVNVPACVLVDDRSVDAASGACALFGSAPPMTLCRSNAWQRSIALHNSRTLPGQGRDKSQFAPSADSVLGIPASLVARPASAARRKKCVASGTMSGWRSRNAGRRIDSTAGFLAHHVVQAPTFLTLAAIASAGFLLFAFKMPETLHHYTPRNDAAPAHGKYSGSQQSETS